MRTNYGAFTVGWLEKQCFLGIVCGYWIIFYGIGVKHSSKSHQIILIF